MHLRMEVDSGVGPTCSIKYLFGLTLKSHLYREGFNKIENSIFFLKKSIRFKHQILPKNQFKTKLFFQAEGSPRLGSWSNLKMTGVVKTTD